MMRLLLSLLLMVSLKLLERLTLLFHKSVFCVLVL
jgi:hypothetical protein